MNDSDSSDYGSAWTRPQYHRPDHQRTRRNRFGAFLRAVCARMVRRARYYYRVWHYAFGAWPSLFYPLYAWREGAGSPHPVRRDTDIVIEGYPRSGNTFVVHAFRLAQDRPVRIADHIHVPAQIMRAAAYGIPACVLIRRPDDVVRSLTVKYPELHVRHALQGYINFYTDCWAHRDRFVVAEFDTATRNFGVTIDAVNRRFGTSFRRFEHAPADAARVFAQLDRRNAEINLGDPRASYRPNEVKEAEKQRLDLAPHAAQLARAEGIYRRYLALARRDAVHGDAHGDNDCAEPARRAGAA